METVADDIALDLAFSPSTEIACLSGANVKDLKILKTDREPYLSLCFSKKKGNDFISGKMYRILTEIGVATKFSINLEERVGSTTFSMKKFTGIIRYVPYIHYLGLDIILRMIRGNGGTYHLLYSDGMHYADVMMNGNYADASDKSALIAIKKAVLNGVGDKFRDQELMYYDFRSEEEIIDSAIKSFLERVDKKEKEEARDPIPFVAKGL